MEGIKRKRLGSQAWQELFERHAASGGGIGEFCRREGVSPHSYRRWKARLAGDAEAVKPAAASGVASQAFVDLGAIAGTPPAASHRLELRLDLGGGLSLHLVRG